MLRLLGADSGSPLLYSPMRIEESEHVRVHGWGVLPGRAPTTPQQMYRVEYVRMHTWNLMLRGTLWNRPAGSHTWLPAQSRFAYTLGCLYSRALLGVTQRG